MLWGFMGLPTRDVEEGGLRGVDSIDTIIVGLGLVLVLLVLLRR